MSRAAAALAPIRVVVVDDQHLVRRGIIALLSLSGSVQVVGEAPDGEAGLRLVEQVRPDVVLLDLRMPRMGGLDMLRALGQRDGVGPPVLVLTTFDDGEAVLEAMRLGAKGYLLKDVSLDQLVDAIQTLAAGGRVVAPGITAGLLERVTHRMPGEESGFEAADAPQPLTEREVEVLRLVAAGYANREIANALFLAEGTVKNHVSSVLLKLGVRDRTRAVLRAIELGLVTG